MINLMEMTFLSGYPYLNLTAIISQITMISYITYDTYTTSQHLQNKLTDTQKALEEVRKENTKLSCELSTLKTTSELLLSQARKDTARLQADLQRCCPLSYC